MADKPESWAAVLRELHEKVLAPGYRAIENHAALVGDVGQLSKSTVGDLLNGKGNPRPRSIEAFVKACLHYADMRRPRIQLPEGQGVPQYWMDRYNRASRIADSRSQQLRASIEGANAAVRTVRKPELQVTATAGRMNVHFSETRQQQASVFEELAVARQQIIESMQVERDLGRVVAILQGWILQLQDTIKRSEFIHAEESRTAREAQAQAEHQLRLAEAERTTAVHLLRLAWAKLRNLQEKVDIETELPSIEIEATDILLTEIDRFLEEQNARLRRLSAVLDTADEITVVVVDDHAIVWDGVKIWLSEASPSIRVIATGTTVHEALNGPGRSADVVLIDLNRNFGTHRDSGWTIPSEYADLQRLVDAGRRVVVYSAQVDENAILRSIGIGAHAFIPKWEGKEHLIEAIRAAASGKPYRLPDVAMAMKLPPLRRPRLTDREREVLIAYCAGIAEERIGRLLRLSASVVSDHIGHLYAKYAALERPVETKSQLTQFALNDGLMTWAEYQSKLRCDGDESA